MRWLTYLLLTVAAGAQELRVYSEFRRIGASGEIVAADRGGQPREILSPGVLRNAFSSFRIAITQPAASEVLLEIGQNPENAVDITLYEESADGQLRRVTMPYKSTMPAGATTLPIWMDMWVRRNARVERIKVEPQLYFGGRWYTYPMEVRILHAVVPTAAVSRRVPLDPALPADVPARAVLKDRFCGVPISSPADTSLRWADLIARNVLQDISLIPKTQAEALLLKASGAASIDRWCNQPPSTANGPEWYLRFRDLVYRAVSKPI